MLRLLGKLIIAVVLVPVVIFWFLYLPLLVLPAHAWNTAVFFVATLLFVALGRGVAHGLKRLGREHSLAVVQAVTVLAGTVLLAGTLHSWTMWQEHVFWKTLADSDNIVVMAPSYGGFLQVADPRTKSVRTIMPPEGYFPGEAVLSPDGRKIAVCRRYHPRPKLMILRAGGPEVSTEAVWPREDPESDEQGAATDRYVSELSWCPSSRYLAFVRKDAPDSVLCVWDDERGELRSWPEVHPAMGPEASPPSWHPGRDALVFEDVEHSISTLDMDTGEVRRICRGRNPQWVRDDSLIVRSDGVYRTCGLESGMGPVIMDAPSNSLGGRWSPDGSLLCYRDFAPQEWYNVGVVGLANTTGSTGQLEVKEFLKSVQLLRRPAEGVAFPALPQKGRH
jgi:hypothetical protein